jgi:hypothetical protein
MFANLQRYLRKRRGSAEAHGEPNPDARFVALSILLTVVLIIVIAVLWSAL